MLWMAAFHFAFDLNHFGLIEPRQNFYTDAVWTGQRTIIVSTFLLCAGLGQSIAMAAGQGWPRFWKRWAQIAACAVAVSIGSAIMFPRSWIFFGVLHGMAVMLLVTRLTGRWGRWLWALGALALVAPWVWQHPAFNAKALAWIGLVTRKPITEDFVPVLPWLGVMALGLLAGRVLLRRAPALLAAPLARPLRPLAVLGRWSLSFYMLHQPVLIALILAGMALAGRGLRLS